MAWRKTGHLFVVCDGMGGHAVGELASRLAVETVTHTFLKSSQSDPAKSLHQAIVAANQVVHSKGSQNADFHQMGTTCTTLALTSRGAIVGHIGDSRAYRLRRDRIDQLTFDHSLEWEFERKHGNLDGIVNLAQHRNVITRSLGPDSLIDVDIEGPIPILPGDTFLLCSDGLSNQVDDPEIGAILRELPPKQAARLLVHLANIRGGPDNSTVVIARVGDLPANVAPSNVEIEEDDDRFQLGWGWLLGYWAAAMFLVAGIAMLMFNKQVQGAVTTGLSVIGLVALIIGTVRQRRSQVVHTPDESHTRIFRPHRTAVSLPSKDLFERLATIDSELQRSAREDGWDVSWNDHGKSVTAAEEAAKDRRYGKAVREIAKAVCLIMDALPRKGTAKIAGD
ncbi:MAG: serine/threonine-protein phosphatase [Planctomycetaceae bacterium]|nr:serine/threonine-protein phosphatase [Planctomycetaceae bacterium]